MKETKSVDVCVSDLPRYFGLDHIFLHVMEITDSMQCFPQDFFLSSGGWGRHEGKEVGKC